MIDPKEVEALRADLELITKTAKVLSTKLEKVTARYEKLIASLEGIPFPQSPVAKTSEVKPTPRPTPRPAPSPSTPTQAIKSPGSTKATRLLDSFLSQIQAMTKGSEISKALSHLRDQVMQSAEVGFHPAFHEMGRYANQIKNIKEISSVDKEQLIEKIYDWKARLAS